MIGHLWERWSVCEAIEAQCVADDRPWVLSYISSLGVNWKIGYQLFNDLQTPKLSKKQIRD